MNVDFPEQCLFINVDAMISLFGKMFCVLINFVVGDGFYGRRIWKDFYKADFFL